MSTGHIELSLRSSTPRGARYGAVATVEMLMPNAGSEVFKPRDYAVPSDAGKLRLDVPPGVYRVRVILPSGRILEQQRTVRPHEVATVVFAPRVKTREAVRAVASHRGAGASTDDAAAYVDASPFTDEFGSFNSIESVLPTDLLEPPVPRRAALARNPLEFHAAVGPIAREAAPVGVVDPVLRSADPVGTWTLFADARSSAPTRGWNEVEASRADSVGAPETQRFWYFAPSDHGMRALSVPFIASSAMKAIVYPSNREGFCIQLVDPVFGGLFECFERGRMAIAAKLLDAVERSDGGKSIRDPLVACIAAYIRLAVDDGTTSTREENPESVGWDIPDFSVVRAKRHLLDATDAGDRYERAFVAAKRAVDLGVPFFSVGLLHLREVLDVLRSYSREADTMASLVTRVVEKVDPAHALTVLSIADRADAEPRGGVRYNFD